MACVGGNVELSDQPAKGSWQTVTPGPLPNSPELLACSRSLTLRPFFIRRLPRQTSEPRHDGIVQLHQHDESDAQIRAENAKQRTQRVHGLRKDDTAFDSA